MYKAFRVFLLFLFIGVSSKLFPQHNLYIPHEILEAYENGTRQPNGMPGQNYWQNHSDYKFRVSINPKTRILSGEGSVIYYNNSPDTLSTIVIKLHQDIYKHDAVRDFTFSKSSLNDGVSIKNLIVKGKEIPLNSKQVERTGTNLIIKLEEKLGKEKIPISFKWSFLIPDKDHVRMGAYGDSVFFVAYWYPEVAVYDDIDGWDLTNYTGYAEFYHDISNYDVEIEMPPNFSVWATGVLQNPDEIYSEKILSRYKKALTSDSIINIITTKELGGDTIHQKKNKLIWHYKADKISDFAFGIGYKYLWDGVSVIADSNEKRRVFVSAAYKPSSQDFYKVAHIAKTTIEMLSKNFPAVPFPHPCMTVFNGRGGMEFPMIVNDGTTNVWRTTVHLTSHEITHTYFPFYMGTNERKYAFMDEGWAVMMPAEIQNCLAPAYFPDSTNVENYLNYAGKEIEVPPITPSYLIKGQTYRTAAYYRPAAAYFILRDMLGKEKFDNALREYMIRWNGKHPMPYDFFFTFNDYLKENLNWFWKPWFFEEAVPDLGIKDVKLDGDKIKILVEKIGDIPIPIHLKLKFENKKVEELNKKADVWKNGQSEIWIEFQSYKDLKSITLGNSKIPDVNKKNNSYVVTNIPYSN